METILYEIESKKRFSESKIWQLNRDFYKKNGVKAFSENIVPHHLTSNAFVGKTYAELIFGFLLDLAHKGQSTETVYLLELGAGHGRLAFHILKHLNSLLEITNAPTPPFCYILSDIGEKNLNFFHQHPQFQEFYENGTMDLAYFDANVSNTLKLRHAKENLLVQELKQPLIAIANYFFDSISSELILVKDGNLHECFVSIHSKADPKEEDLETLTNEYVYNYHHEPLDINSFLDSSLRKILEDYKALENGTYFFFPKTAIECINRLKNLSESGLLLLSIDKGFHEKHDLETIKSPDIVMHGSWSIWVNFHALASFCSGQGGHSLMPKSSSFHFILASLLFLDHGKSYENTILAYQRFVDRFGPDDFNSLKHFSYANVDLLNAQELLALIRLSSYDSAFFIKLLPRLKQVAKAITFNERKRISEAMKQVWSMYFSIGESYDLAYEIGGVSYDLGFYQEALTYFKRSIEQNGHKPDILYNLALTYYQLRQDKSFLETVRSAKKEFPKDELFNHLDTLDVS